MAEPDAAGPGDAGGPKKRALTTREEILAAIETEWAALTPEERAQRKAEADKADREAFEEASRAVRSTFEAIERHAERARQFWSPIQLTLDPNGRAEAVGDLLSRIEPADSPVDLEEIRAVVADAVKAAMDESKKDRKPRGETTCERLRDLHENIDKDFAETASVRQVGKRIERSPGTFPDSHYWRTVLQPKRAEVRVEIREAKRKQREAHRYGHFDSVGRTDEDSRDH